LPDIAIVVVIKPIAIRRKAVVENVVIRRVVEGTRIGFEVLKRDEMSFPFCGELTSGGYCERQQKESGRAEQGEGTAVHKKVQ
jgi:hypothetical protein